MQPLSIIERYTASMRHGLLDSLGEDPDVVVVGEMRDPETMRLTLNAAETGHLVFATMHSGSCIEALARIVSAFPAEIQYLGRGPARQYSRGHRLPASALPQRSRHPDPGMRNPPHDPGREERLGRDPPYRRRSRISR